MPIPMMIVGEYLSKDDADEGAPFSSRTNYIFKGMLKQAGISPREVVFDNVINEPPSWDNPLAFCGPKDAGKPGVKFFKRGKYLRAEYFHHVERLWKRINQLQPNVIVAAGELALWALTSETSMEAARGRPHRANSALPDRKVLPCYSPKHVVQNYSDRLILLSDLEKARYQSTFPELQYPERFIHLYPSIDDLESFLDTYIRPAIELDIDIETKSQTITCFGVAVDKTRALVVPFYDETKPDGNYWPTAKEEKYAWQWVERVLALPNKRMGGQNFQYDMQYLWRKMGIPSPGFADDTMLMHHALYPELAKGLGFLGSLYTNQPPWKFMRQKHHSDKSGKKEDI